jgi:hypothetical protein
VAVSFTSRANRATPSGWKRAFDMAMLMAAFMRGGVRTGGPAQRRGKSHRVAVAVDGAGDALAALSWSSSRRGRAAPMGSWWPAYALPSSRRQVAGSEAKVLEDLEHLGHRLLQRSRVRATAGGVGRSVL